jgi:glutamate-1-semialdehyde 2,1-aminomutase
LQTHRLEDIWNSLYMRGVRRDMLTGRHVAACSHCYLEEKAGVRSHRQLVNASWAGELGPLFDALVEESLCREHELPGGPLYYQLMPGNLCNLKCRMCSPTFSSQIERDPVHRHWNPPLVAEPSPDINGLDWTRGCVELAPALVQGVHLEGFHDCETHDGDRFRWTNGNATLTAPLPPGLEPTSLVLSLRCILRKRHRLRVLVNGAVVYDGLLPRWRKQARYTFGVAHLANRSTLTVQFQSDTSRHGSDPRDLGVCVEQLDLLHTAVPATSRLPDGPWYRDDAWVRDVLFQNADRMRALYFTGGEPMIEKQVQNILQHLIERKAAGNIVLELNTNCTILRPKVLEMFQPFKLVRLGLSIDAFGLNYEYIRYPAKWATVSRNVEVLTSMNSERFRQIGCVVLQVYNALNITEVFEFFERMQIPYQVQFATWPTFLNVGVLPLRVRALAAERIRAFAPRCADEAVRQHLLSVVRQIEVIKTRSTLEALRNLMLFTNDLDAGRRQDVRAVHGELLGLLDEEGFSWTDEHSAFGAVA